MLDLCVTQNHHLYDATSFTLAIAAQDYEPFRKTLHWIYKLALGEGLLCPTVRKNGKTLVVQWEDLKDNILEFTFDSRDLDIGVKKIVKRKTSYAQCSPCPTAVARIFKEFNHASR